MKLCKDCKHAVMPNPLLNLQLACNGQTAHYVPMCGHPDAKRSLVDGSLQTTCVEARESGTDKMICCNEAKLFEQAPPKEEPELKTYSIVPVEVTPEKPSFWRRIFG